MAWNVLKVETKQNIDIWQHIFWYHADMYIKKKIVIVVEL